VAGRRDAQAVIETAAAATSSQRAEERATRIMSEFLSVSAPE
jgi:hypothetical protein